MTAAASQGPSASVQRTAGCPGITARRPRWLAVAAAAAGLWACGLAQAAFPSAYNPLVVQPQVVDGRQEFDLRPAQAQARQSGRRLYVYLGASDCSYCRKYEAFLTQNAQALVPQFAAHHYLVVDLRSALSITAPQLVLRTEQHQLPYADFQRAIGDARARLLVYPSVWVMDAQGKPLMQMPAGTGTFQTVAEQLEILRLEE